MLSVVAVPGKSSRAAGRGESGHAGGFLPPRHDGASELLYSGGAEEGDVLDAGALDAENVRCGCRIWKLAALRRLVGRLPPEPAMLRRGPRVAQPHFCDYYMTNWEEGDVERGRHTARPLPTTMGSLLLPLRG